MKKNVGTLDAILRFTIGATLFLSGLFLWGGLSGNIISIIVAVIGLVLVATAAMNWCPIWMALGINTHKKEETK